MGNYLFILMRILSRAVLLLIVDSFAEMKIRETNHRENEKACKLCWWFAILFGWLVKSSN